MLKKPFQDKMLPLLGFGTMRLPTKEGGVIDEEAFAEMVKLSMNAGANYFDTAYPYHGGMSEIAVGKVLKKYPRDSYYLATKYPGHQIVKTYDPAVIFEEQLRKCGVDYFDFYLLHNVYEASMEIYLDPKWGIIDYFKEQKRLGRIKHLGFSCHAATEGLRTFLDAVGEDMEFCQIQANWVDWTLQDAKSKMELLNERNVPIWIMEPVRGGKLCHLSEANEKLLKDLRPDESIAAWGFRFLMDLPGVTVILSGMSNMEQMQDNINTFEGAKLLSKQERELLLEIAERVKSSVPCTACRYCTSDCPVNLDIPRLISTYNDLSFVPATNSAMWLEDRSENEQPTACIACGKCKVTCPQKIDVPEIMKKLSEKLQTVPKWREICREREEAARRLRGE